MPRKTTPLSDTEIRRTKHRVSEFNLSDGDGLQLRIKPNGSKLWIFNYTHAYSKKRVNLSLGSYPTLSLAKAREARQKFNSLIAEGTDPRQYRSDQALRNADAAEATLEYVANKWFELKQTKVTEAYAEDIIRSLRLHIFPQLGATPIHLIKANLVINTLKPIEAKGTQETVKRLCQRLNEIMAFSVNSGLVEANPLSHIGKTFISPQKSLMPSITPAQLPNLMKNIANASIKKTTRCLIEWQLQTMTRPSEAAGAKWEEIDFDKHLWVIPAQRMKKRLKHTIPLTSHALALLEFMKQISGNREHIFPADRNPRTHINSQTANMALKRMGYKGTLVAHGLRSMASTALNEQGFDSDLIESALAHIGNDRVRTAYNRAEYIERRRPMMTWWSEQIEKAASGNHSLTSFSSLP